MLILEKYVITTETSILFPYYDSCGRLMSMILEGDQILFVDSRPTEIIDYNLRRGGSSLKGAAEGADELLGRTFMAPVSISKTHSIYMTPTCSPKADACIWLAVGHVDTYVCNSSGTVTVRLRNGSVAELPLSPYQFKERVRQACTLQYSIETNTRQAMKVKEDYTQSYILKKPEKGMNYEGE
ncbi:competence protein ComK [Sporosarcina trichiuri]|uniref:competence protein ComK n=1 Tax=Sporosarcina trichiuri TaxID=3056445 RepID=UPI0025B4999D|nr:competence protein ComK [Sporosarcina sp. 0.2-SM1T-5]WJY26321.1 competence protein ComK [Sporosarcina sp. 0.2-SM1T-5]